MSERYQYGFHRVINMYCVVDTLKETAIKFFTNVNDARKFSELKNKLESKG